jgi:hypothetical protein
LVIIDFQPVQVSSIQSRSKRERVANITALARIGKLYGGFSVTGAKIPN